VVDVVVAVVAATALDGATGWFRARRWREKEDVDKKAGLLGATTCAAPIAIDDDGHDDVAKAVQQSVRGLAATSSSDIAASSRGAVEEQRRNRHILFVAVLCLSQQRKLCLIERGREAKTCMVYDNQWSLWLTRGMHWLPIFVLQCTVRCDVSGAEKEMTAY